MLLFPPPLRLIETMNKLRVLTEVKVRLLLRNAEKLDEDFIVAAFELVLRFAQGEAAGLLFAGVVHVDYAVVPDVLFFGCEDVAARDALDGPEVTDVGVAEVALED
jgi:hypothetical protein